ncbi:MAG TPA: hypothetical protein VHS31_13270 [Tepidisphaeraceae bacterium]|jgi:hypothetical protein|nr:hypothetical protein [Tepidisphaeraceae bacterium]
MGTSFVTADGEHGFGMRDGILELWLRLLSLHIPEPADADSDTVHQVSRQIRDKWLLASKGYFNGCVPCGLENAVATPEGRTVVRCTIDSLRAALLKMPPTLDMNVLNLLGFSLRGLIWTSDLETRRLIETADAFLELLDGKVIDTASSTARMPGSR